MADGLPVWWRALTPGPSPACGKEGTSPPAPLALQTSLPLGIVLLAWLLRCWHLSFYDFRGDEVFGIEYVTAPIGRIIQRLAEGEPHPPLFYLLLHSWIPITGDGSYALRWLSAAGGALVVALLYAIGHRLAGRSVGLAAALITAMAPYQVWNAQDARMYTLATGFTTATAYWAWRLLAGDVAPGWRSAAAYVAASLLALYTHYYSIYVLLLLNAFAAAALLAAGLARQACAVDRAPEQSSVAAPAVRSKQMMIFEEARSAGVPSRPAAWLPDGRPFRPLPQRAGWRVRALLWALAQLAVAAMYLPWMAYAWPTLTTYHGNAGSPGLAEAIRSSLSTFALGWDLPAQATSRLLPIYAVALVVGLLCCRWLRRPGLAALLLALWLVVPIGAIWLASRARPIFDVRYLIEASPPFYLLLALPACWLRRTSLPQAIIASAILTAVLAPLFPALWALYFHPTDGRGHAYSALGAYLAAHVSPTDVVVVNHLDPVVRYYAQHAKISAPLVTEPTVAAPTAADLNAALQRITSGRARVWLIPDDVGAWDRQHAVLAWLDRHAQRVTQVAAGFHVIEFVPLTPAQDADVAFGNAMVLQGYRLQPAHWSPGETTQVTLFWQARSPIGVADTVSVQLLDQSGRLIAQDDSPPQGGQAPTTTWQTFEVIPDIHTLRLPSALPAGVYSIGIAVYPSHGGARLPVASAPTGLAPLATISIP